MMMIRMKWLLMGLILTGFCFGTGVNPNPVYSENAPAELLASVGDQTITAEAFQAAISRRPGRATSLQNKEALLEDMVRFELLCAAALTAGYDKDPEILLSLKRRMAHKYRTDVLEPRFEKIRVSDKDIEKYYRKHQADFVTPKMVRAAVIRISVAANASKQKKARNLKRAEAARAEALNLGSATPSFGSVAVKYSDHQPTRYRGGNTGWLQPDKGDRRWPDEVMKAVFSLEETGKVGPLITTPTGYYLVKLMETKERAPRSLGALKARIRHQLLTEKKAEVERKFYQELKGKVPVKVDRARLEAIEPSRGEPPGLPGQ